MPTNFGYGIHNRYPGDYVAIEFITTDATTAAAITLKDANDAVRTLQPNERLVVDALTGSLDPAKTTVIVTLFADADADGNVDATEFTVDFSYVISVFDGGAEGYSFPIGITPKIKESAAGAFKLTGTGRIVTGKSEGVRPSWRQSGTPGM